MGFQEKRQTVMLSLEITDYEKKLQDMSEKLDEARRQNENQAVLAAEADNKIIALELNITKLNDTIDEGNRAKVQLEVRIEFISGMICEIKIKMKLLV